MEIDSLEVKWDVEDRKLMQTIIEITSESRYTSFVEIFTAQ